MSNISRFLLILSFASVPFLLYLETLDSPVFHRFSWLRIVLHVLFLPLSLFFGAFIFWGAFGLFLILPTLVFGLILLLVLALPRAFLYLSAFFLILISIPFWVFQISALVDLFILLAFFILVFSLVRDLVGNVFSS